MAVAVANGEDVTTAMAGDDSLGAVEPDSATHPATIVTVATSAASVRVAPLTITSPV